MKSVKKKFSSVGRSELIKIAISSCLLGNRVRYNGESKLNRILIETMNDRVKLIPICPEVECGMDVPREPADLVMDKSGLHLITRSGNELTEKLIKWSENRVKRLKAEGVKGIILKSRSPSCGLYDAQIYDSLNKKWVKGMGLFTAIVIEHIPEIAVEDEAHLNSIEKITGFIERIVEEG